VPAPTDAAAPTSVSDIFATAFVRYGGGFVTFGLMALAATVPPALLLGVVVAADAASRLRLLSVALVATIAYLAFVGSVTASIGLRLRSRLLAILWTSVLASPPIVLVIVLVGPFTVFVLPFMLPFFALAPVAAGADDGSGVNACRRSLVLVARNGYLRSLGVMAGLEVVGLMLAIGFWIAFEPLGVNARRAVAVVLWALVFWPISALVLRALYGALSGRLVVRT
jgi:hypothetical protein